ncbi:nitrate reductase associated protein [Chamaesiphon sp. VAR_48_metabat_135_sub]|uniref:nitrate reductase associated protein n=1 Tax=Chamaesiphon sp. VAR_48_metabat_135_sub TaxID=2964699 RepID=UPI00286B74E9|nr:nitrate reductase associated protein [Chamaesiphon sp. VAR_48_metabat_135_sub]
MTFFNFEADFVDSLRCIPMIVRLKLDTCGVKLKLAEWNHFSQSECEQLVELPCEEAADIAAYKEYVSKLIFQHTKNEASLLSIDPHPPWLNDREIPTSIATKATEQQVNITLTQWANLTPLQRFALIKLTRSQHENNNFLPALTEFGLSN